MIVQIFLCGDVMTGRGIDQILPNPADPVLYEPFVKDARDYRYLAEQQNGPIPSPVSFRYIWGQALDELNRRNTDIRIINLETSITNSKNYWKGKGINYKMNPQNIGCLTDAKISCCSLSNNHVADWGFNGLIQTCDSLNEAGIQYAGAGLNRREAQTPAILNLKQKGRIVFFSTGSQSSGIPPDWEAKADHPGVYLIDEYSSRPVEKIAENISQIKKPGDIFVVSIHWGENWGFEIPDKQIEFAHNLIDYAGVDIVHGHSSHHFKGIEVYNKKPVLYGCGDFINDYEGIGGYEEFRSDLVLMYFISINNIEHNLVRINLVPFRLKKFTLNRIDSDDIEWTAQVLNKNGIQFKTRVKYCEKYGFNLEW